MENKQTILIVDDIADNLDVAAEILMQDGLSIILAESGSKALVFAAKFIPDLILLDIMMPDVDGYEVCRQLKSNELTKEIPVIFLSAISETKNIVKGFELGAVDYINKPFIPEELISRVETHLKIHLQKQDLQNKEKLLQESEAKLLSVINSIPDLIFYKDIESNYTGFNKAFSKYLGEKPEDIIGNNDFNFYKQKDAQIFHDADKKIINFNDDGFFKEWTRDFEGNKIYLDTRKTALKNSEGKTVGIVGVSRNMTELKISELALKDKEEKLSNIYDNANEGIFVLQNNKLIFFNNKLSEIIGFSKEKLQTSSFLTFIHKDDRENTAVYYNKILKGEKIGKTIIFRIIDVNNKTIYVRINSKQISWDDCDAILGMLDDITEQYLLEKELKESKERLSLSQKAGKIGAWEWDFQTNKMRWSDITFEIFEKKPISPYISNQEFLTYVHSDDRKRIVEEFDAAINNKKVEHKIEYRIINGNDKLCWIEETSDILYNSSGGAERMIGVIQDVTDRKLSEKELELKNIEIKKNRDEIISSIKYAKTIQTSLLPEQSVIDEIIRKNFILYKPKDLVSGDFYYVNKIEDVIYFSVADCTGHGVPGGFITMLGINIIHGILKEKKAIEPSEILNCLRNRIKDVFKGVEKDNYNGMDMAFCTINTKTNILQYSGAFNPLWVIRNGELIEIKATRNPIGFYPEEKEFQNNTFQLKNKDKLYLFSDGYKDQIGGPKNKKYNNIRFKKRILQISNFPIKEQESLLLGTLEKWQVNNEQIDDITIMGVEWEM